MSKDLVVSNNDSNSSSESNEGIYSLNKNSFNHLSKTNSNNIDFADDSPNFNDADYEDAWNKAEANDSTNGNFYDESNEYYSKGSVYKNDFTEDFPGVNSTYLSKLRADIKDSYATKSKSVETDSDLVLNNDTSKQIFGFLKDEVQFEKDKILFKSPTFNSIHPEFIDKNPFKPVIVSFVLWFFSLFLFNYLLKNFIFFIIGGISCALVFLMILSIFLITYAKQVSSNHYLVLDYSKQIFYQEKRTSFKNIIKPLFSFNEIVDIGLSNEKVTIDGTSYNLPTIYFLLKNGNSFKFCQADQKATDSFTYYTKVVQILSLALKKTYFNNPHNLQLYKRTNLEKVTYFTTECGSSDLLSSNYVVIPEKKSFETTTYVLIFILGLYYLGLLGFIFAYRF